MSKVTPKYRKMAQVYKIFASGWDNLDYSEQALQEMYDYESTGKGNIAISVFNKSNNAYAVGKKWTDVQVSMWLDWLKKPGWMNILEDLYNDEFPHWWLDSIFYNFIRDKVLLYKSMGMRWSNMPKRNFNKMRKESCQK